MVLQEDFATVKDPLQTSFQIVNRDIGCKVIYECFYLIVCWEFLLKIVKSKAHDLLIFNGKKPS